MTRPVTDEHLWYYTSLAGCYRERVPARLAGELDRVLAELHALAGL